MLRKTSLYLYLAIVFSGCLNQREEYALYGHVKDQAGLPIKDVKFSVPKDEISAVTDEFGYYIMSEEQFDPLLNPTRAKVDLTLNVLSYHDLQVTNPGQAIFFAHQIIKELLATSNIVNSATNLGVSLKL